MAHRQCGGERGLGAQVSNAGAVAPVAAQPQARGSGLGGRLVDECIAFARAKGYRKIRLWTHRCLHAARAIYAKRGFRLLKSTPYQGFGHDLVGETWELRL